MAETTCEGEQQILNRLRRFLNYGTESGCCLVEPEKEKGRKDNFTKESALSVKCLLKEGKGVEVVEEILKCSKSNSSSKSNPMIFALAMCAHLSKDTETVHKAYTALTDICKIPTHLFLFVKYSEKLKKNSDNNQSSTGWGAGQRRAISRWYNNKDPKNLAMLVTKYIQRQGWSHVDILRLAHVKPKNNAIGAVLRYITKGMDKMKAEFDKEDCDPETKEVLEYLEAVHTVKHTKDPQEAASLIEEHKLQREHIATWHAKNKEVWKALIPHMPMAALLKNLGKMSSLQLLDVESHISTMIISKIKNLDAIRSANVHPFSILLALSTYESGKGIKGAKTTWKPNMSIVEALKEAFYASFENVPPTGKRLLLALDVSNSMKQNGVIGSSNISPVNASIAMAMAVAKTEQNYKVIAFSQDIVELEISPEYKLEDVLASIKKVPHGSTDCNKPIEWALEKKESFEGIVIYTDVSPWNKEESKPVDLLKKYRAELNVPDAKLIVCALTSESITVADPSDNGMLDLAGFNNATPNVIQSFLRGEI